MIISVEDKSYRCKDCDSFGQCEYYNNRRPTSHICKEFTNDSKVAEILNKISAEIEINTVLDEISGEIEGLTHLEMCGVVTPLVNGDRVLEIIEKHRRE